MYFKSFLISRLLTIFIHLQYNHHITIYLLSSLIPFKIFSNLIIFTNGSHTPRVSLNTTASTHQFPAPILAINCGGSRYFDASMNIDYSADKNFKLGNVFSFEKESTYNIEKNNPIYSSDRYGNFSYFINIPKDNIYTLVLKFIETKWKNQKNRVFNVQIGGHTILRNFDLNKIAGYSIAHEEYIELERKGNDLFIDGILAKEKDWISYKSELFINFISISQYGLPKVNSIVLYDQSIQQIPQLVDNLLNLKGILEDVVATNNLISNSHFSKKNNFSLLDEFEIINRFESKDIEKDDSEILNSLESKNISIFKLILIASISVIICTLAIQTTIWCLMVGIQNNYSTNKTCKKV